MRQQALELMAQARDVPARFRRCAEDAQPWPILDELDTRIAGLMHDGGILILSSQVGVGKTFGMHYAGHLCRAWFRSLSYEQRLPFLDFSQAIGGTWTQPKFADFRDLPGLAISNKDEYFATIMWRGLLLLDEVGAEIIGKSDWAGMTLERLVDERYVEELPTIMATNLTAGEFTQRYGERLVDRVRECGEFLSISGTSRREEARDFPPIQRTFGYRDLVSLPNHQESTIRGHLAEEGRLPEWVMEGDEATGRTRVRRPYLDPEETAQEDAQAGPVAADVRGSVAEAGQEADPAGVAV